MRDICLSGGGCDSFVGPHGRLGETSEVDIPALETHLPAREWDQVLQFSERNRLPDSITARDSLPRRSLLP
jgi:hypothetical protein